MARGTYKYLCGVPSGECMSKPVVLNNGLKNKGLAGHQSSEQAFNCMKRHLLKQGFKQVDSRAFQPPGGGEIRVLSKKSRFGAKMRPGKEGTRNQPYCHGSMCRGGVIISK